MILHDTKGLGEVFSSSYSPAPLPHGGARPLTCVLPGEGVGWQSFSFVDSPVRADGAGMTAFLFTSESNLESCNASESVLVLPPS